MAMEIICMLIVSYILMFGEWTSPLFKHNHCIFRLIEIAIPKVMGISILLYIIIKYLFKLN